MKLKKCFLAICWLISPSVFAVGEPEHPGDTELEKMILGPSTEAAFDRSGKHVTHSFRADGVMLAEYHGTMGSVTVARVGKDGQIEHLCTTDREEAIQFMSGEEPVKRESLVELHLEAR